MEKPFRVWNAGHQFGDVDVASFAHREDAELFIRAKAKKEGGYETGFFVGETWETRERVSNVD